ncbi:hypothetical protein SAMN05660484_02263 [Eubacterium ruminantium]|uniref:Uncharacterized protein n=1 Tax=Eubacterium ruminantium TaxID=42322 RepID=A0A1T4Q2N1_9FIRM|nr:hypothetical protein [Eubacterium ruminantium]SCW64582.1 hypothetical protein SAMN05660484_02263 [Eubacterium ruminantium]SDN29219.1 hypothetical protein SAMN04490370_1167 [Eubacterium ruminantium]SJZ97886.1 hypothetical protein SAMN02745110_02220 [Eubacterium ruminantium]
MAISDGNLSAADIAAVTGGNGFGFGNDGGAFWLLVLFLFAFNGGWGNGFGGGNNGVPYMVNDVQRGFDQSAVMSGIAGIQASISNGFSNSEISQCNQTANLTGQLSALALNQATNACNTNANIADLKYTVATEACADRSAVTDALQSVTNTINIGIQSLKDQLNAQTLEQKNEEIANLRTQINLSNLAASQNAQTAALVADNNAQTQYLINKIVPTPVPAYFLPNFYGNYGSGYGYGYGANGFVG